MARFYGAVQGNRGEATRMGTADSGIESHTRGWGIGARVYVRPSLPAHVKSSLDEVRVDITGGSNNPSKVVGSVVATELQGGDIRLRYVLPDGRAFEARLDRAQRFGIVTDFTELVPAR